MKNARRPESRPRALIGVAGAVRDSPIFAETKIGTVPGKLPDKDSNLGQSG